MSHDSSDDTDSVREGIKLLRRRVRGAMAGAICIPIITLSMLALANEVVVLGSQLRDVIGWIWLAGNGGLVLYLMIRITSSRCPKCGKRFFVRVGYRNTFSRHCLHCGLPLTFPKRTRKQSE